MAKCAYKCFEIYFNNEWQKNYQKVSLAQKLCKLNSSCVFIGQQWNYRNAKCFFMSKLLLKYGSRWVATKLA